MERYIGMDVHSASCTAVVLSAKGKRLTTTVVETNGKSLVGFLLTIPGNRHLAIEEGTHAAWLYEILSPHVQEMVVVGAPKAKNNGQKSDKLDAYGLAEKLRIGSIERRVYKWLGTLSMLSSLSKAYANVMVDSVRVMSRLKGVFRSRGIPTGERQIYSQDTKEEWLKKLPTKIRPLAATYYAELEALLPVREQALKDMLKESRRHRVFHILKTIPGMGDRRVSELLPIVITPYRFPNKRAFWDYCGLGVVTRSSSDWVRTPDGKWVKAATIQTRGLNFNHNHTLKKIFKGAATSVVGQKRAQEPIYQHYLSLLDNGTKPNLAKLTIARQIASVTLSLWRSGEEYDGKKMKKK
jgi:transposase